jgi:hypothetical protein
MAVELTGLIGRVSPSKLETAQKCLQQFAFRYVERLPENFRASLQFGIAADDTSNEVYRAKMATGRTPARKDVQDQFAAAWDYASAAVDDWGDESKGELLDVGVKAMAKWRDRIAEFVQPRAVQQTITKVVVDPVTGDSFELKGVLDLRAADPAGVEVAADLKTAGRAYGKDAFERRSQPTAYTLLADLPTFEFHVLTTTKEPQTQVLRATISDSARFAFLKRAGMIRRQIENAFRTGDWLPNRTHMMCSRRYCEFWRECERRNGGQVPA